MTGSLPRSLVLGTGFGSFNLVRHPGLAYDITVLSPRNQFLFTPTSQAEDQEQ